MKKVLSKDLELYFENLFPYKRDKPSNKKHLVLIGIGGNVGNVKRRFKKLFFKMKIDRRVDIIKTSPILKNPPFGFLNQATFLNAVMMIKTNMYLKELFKYLMYLENFFKRDRLFKNSPRTIDIDIIFFDKIVYNKNNLTIPHMRWQNRSSVIIPMLFLKD